MNSNSTNQVFRVLNSRYFWIIYSKYRLTTTSKGDSFSNPSSGNSRNTIKKKFSKGRYSEFFENFGKMNMQASKPFQLHTIIENPGENTTKQ